MTKHEWKFARLGSELLTGAQSKKQICEGKLAWWKTRKEDLIKTIPAGVTMEESQVNYSSATTSFGAPQLIIDPTLQKHLKEAHSRLTNLSERIKEYDGWIQILEKNATQTFSVDHDDWLFFFGKESSAIPIE